MLLIYFSLTQRYMIVPCLNVILILLLMKNTLKIDLKILSFYPISRYICVSSVTFLTFYGEFIYLLCESNIILLTI